ncbi:MAG: hypothetical protein ACK56F_28005, partial [bacterium]
GKMYVAYSYGEQFPLYLNYKDKWYHNSDYYTLDDERINKPSNNILIIKKRWPKLFKNDARCVKEMQSHISTFAECAESPKTEFYIKLPLKITRQKENQ